jgi:peptidoglycan/LPS O-acetylase OafA/YrhL
MSEKPKYISALDGVRGSAAMIVFFVHYGGGLKSHIALVRFFAKAMIFGWSGVSLFFVLSGFLISGILWDSFQQKNWWARFYCRRALRIFPLYYFALTLVLAGAIWANGLQPSLSSIWGYVFYLQDIPGGFNHWEGVPAVFRSSLSHFWSLAVEEQFYLVWPFLLVFWRGNLSGAKGMCIGVWAFSLMFRIAVVTAHWDEGWASGFLLGRGGELALGAYLALAIRDPQAKKFVLRFARPVFVLSVVAILVVIVVAGGTYIDLPLMATAGIAVTSVAWCSLIAICLKPGLATSFFSMSWLRWMGKISYGFYVYHMLLFLPYQRIVDSAFPSLGKDAHFSVLAVVAAVGTLAVASLSYYGFELRFLRLKSYFEAPLTETSQ